MPLPQGYTGDFRLVFLSRVRVQPLCDVLFLPMDIGEHTGAAAVARGLQARLWDQGAALSGPAPPHRKQERGAPWGELGEGEVGTGVGAEQGSRGGSCRQWSLSPLFRQCSLVRTCHHVPAPLCLLGMGDVSSRRSS